MSNFFFLIQASSCTDYLLFVKVDVSALAPYFQHSQPYAGRYVYCTADSPGTLSKGRNCRPDIAH